MNIKNGHRKVTVFFYLDPFIEKRYTKSFTIR